MKSKAYGGIGIMDKYAYHGIKAKLRYYNTKEESITVTTMQIIISNFYNIVRSSEPYNQQQNKCKRKMRDL